jgi:hypothetical protein
MKNTLTICVAVFIVLLSSCSEDSLENKSIKTLTINDKYHTFVNDNGDHYIENTLASQQDSHVYELQMVKGVEYRISSSQPNVLNNQTNLTLLNNVGDTLSESLDEDASKSVIVIKSPETKSYYLIVSLRKRTNPKFDYRLFFEEMTEDNVSFSGFSWKSNGDWNFPDSNTAELTNYDSRIYRHLRLINQVSGNPDVSFVIQTNSNISPNFGFIMEASDELTQLFEYYYELTSSGYAFLTFMDDDNYTIINLSPHSMSFDWGLLTNVNLNLSTGVKVELKYQMNGYCIFLNGTFMKSINGSLNNFYILLQDCGDETSMIKDFKML